MPYVMREVIAGAIREVKKCWTGRVHPKGATRSAQTGTTSEAQAKVNDRKAEEKLRWILNANFVYADLHLVLHYYSKETSVEQAEADKAAFLKALRKWCRKHDVPWKYVAVTEKASKMHHHLVLPPVPAEVLQQIWEEVLQGRMGNISIKPLDRRGNHAKLASYLIKQSRSMAAYWAAQGKRHKRYSVAKGMTVPEPTYKIIAANRWAEEPKPRKGWVLLKDDEGNTCRTGIHEVTGWPWQEYFELRVEAEEKDKQTNTRRNVHGKKNKSITP